MPCLGSALFGKTTGSSAMIGYLDQFEHSREDAKPSIVAVQ